MNIFELYLDKIKSIIVDLSKEGKIIIPETFNGINSEIPPTKFDCDISTNVAMVLSKLNKKSPMDLAEIISPVIKENDSLIQTITIVKPGFINIKFKPIFWSNFIKEIILNAKSFGINEKEKKLNYLVDFVSVIRKLNSMDIYYNGIVCGMEGKEYEIQLVDQDHAYGDHEFCFEKITVKRNKIANFVCKKRRYL